MCGEGKTLENKRKTVKATPSGGGRKRFARRDGPSARAACPIDFGEHSADNAAGETAEDGWVAERLNAPVLKTGSRESGSWVQIPPHPLFNNVSVISTFWAGRRVKQSILIAWTDITPPAGKTAMWFRVLEEPG